ncbi:MAG: family N-acetyltransferase [Frankiales bacterium]|nr:family N-acetyltransferase [Frankiales bacterium]
MELVALTAGRLHVRPWEPWDAAEVQAAFADPEVVRWTTVPSPSTLEGARTFLADSARGWAEGTAASFAVLDATTARVLGGVSLLRIADGSAELSYWSVPEGRGQGFTAEAVGAVTRWGFGALGLDRVVWRTDVGNWGSRAVAQACGFTVEGTLRRAGLDRHGVRTDLWHGSLLADDDAVDRRPFGSWRDLEGDGLRLRRWRGDDVEALVRGCSDPDTARWTPVPVPYGEAEAHAFLEQEQQRWAEGVAAPLAVEQDGQVAGLLVLIPEPRDPGRAELGWWVTPSARGQRVVARAVEALAPWAASLGRVRLEAYVDPANAASLRAAERAGFVHEALLVQERPRLREPGRVDLVLLARLL